MKLDQLLEQHPQEVVFTAKYLKEHGISNTLCQRYQKNGYFTSLGYGTWCLADKNPTFFHGFSCLQKQEKNQFILEV